MPYITPPTVPTEYAERVIRFPKSTYWFGLVGGALSELLYFSQWEQVTGITTAEAADEGKKIYRSWNEGSFMIGAIMAYAGDVSPAGMLRCDGGLYSRSDYPQLWDYLPDDFKTTTDFQVPDLRGLIIISAGEIWGTSIDLEPYEQHGSATHVLTEEQMPSHSHTNIPHEHTYLRPVTGIDLEGPGVPDITAVGNPPLPFQTNATSININASGGGQPHNNMPPVIALQYGIVAR